MAQESVKQHSLPMKPTGIDSVNTQRGGHSDQTERQSSSPRTVPHISSHTQHTSFSKMPHGLPARPVANGRPAPSTFASSPPRTPSTASQQSNFSHLPSKPLTVVNSLPPRPLVSASNGSSLPSKPVESILEPSPATSRASADNRPEPLRRPVSPDRVKDERSPSAALPSTSGAVVKVEEDEATRGSERLAAVERRRLNDEEEEEEKRREAIRKGKGKDESNGVSEKGSGSAFESQRVEDVKPNVEQGVEKEEVKEESREPSRPASSTSGSGSGVVSRSGSRTPKGEENDEEEEEVRSPKKAGKGKGKRKGGNRSTPEKEPQLIGHLPSAEDAASKTYTEITESTYYNKQLGNTPYYNPEDSRCDCSYKPGEPLSEQACGEYSGCMNRMLQMECEEGECRCGGKCQNQRFQHREYAPIEIVKTEKKGFGVRAAADLTADTFVYEYVGEVIGPAPFARKMKEYAQEGIKHFYFMALDKEVFIDATKKGGKGRFLNHSCNPNCQVAKWTIGKKMRMGIFAKRDIKKDEELTFNYNVDRYGHLAQECFCGEPNCVGFIGGKTQTDIGGMDDLYIDALGIAEEVEALGLKGSKKKKGRKLDEDYNPTLTPIISEEVPKVASAIRQALQTRRILEKLLERVKMTWDEEVQRQLLRLHGLSLMNNILKEYPKDKDILLLDLSILTKWKFQTRNKIETSKIEDEVTKFVKHEEENIATMASALLATWSELSLGFRIPKAQRDAESDLKRPAHFDIDQLAKKARLDEDASASTHGTELFDRSKFVRPEANVVTLPSTNRPRKLPPGWSALRGEQDGREYYRNDLSGSTQWEIPIKAAEPPPPKQSQTQVYDVNALVAEAERAAKEAKDAELRRLEAEEEEKKREKEERHRRKKEEKEERDKAQKEKKVTGLFSAVVVATMSKYRSQFEAEAFKKRAKEVTSILIDKEKKRPTYETDVYETLSTEKEAKVKAFVKDWIKKLLERKKAGRSSSSNPSTPRPSSSSSSKPRPSLLNSHSSSSTPKPQGLEIDSPATPQTAPMEVDTPSGDNFDKNGLVDDCATTIPRSVDESS